MTVTAKVHGWIEDERFGNCVNVQLANLYTTPDVFWSARGNSYVLASNAQDAAQPLLVSVNGLGEVRWTVDDRALQRALRHERESWFNPQGDDAETLAAARHFKLV
jgi:hypothetical protein